VISNNRKEKLGRYISKVPSEICLGQSDIKVLSMEGYPIFPDNTEETAIAELETRRLLRLVNAGKLTKRQKEMVVLSGCGVKTRRYCKNIGNCTRNSESSSLSY